MAIYEAYYGDIFAINVDVLVNPVNTVGVMGKGLAKQFKERYPDMFEDYVRICRKGFDIGQLHVYHVSMDKTIINFPTKKHWKDPSSYDYIEAGLKQLTRYLNKNPVETIVIPPLGCGLGGLDFNIVNKMISNILIPATPRKLIVYVVQQ